MIHNTDPQLHLQSVCLQALDCILQLDNWSMIRNRRRPLLHFVLHLVQLLGGHPKLNSQIHHGLVQPVVLLADLLQLLLLSLVVGSSILELRIDKCLLRMDPLQQRSQLRPQLLQLRLGSREGLLDDVFVLFGLGQVSPPLLGVRRHGHPQLRADLLKLDGPLVRINLGLDHLEIFTIVQGLLLLVDHLAVDHLLFIVVQIGVLFVNLLHLRVAVDLGFFGKPLIWPFWSLKHHLLLLQCLFAQRMQHLAHGLPVPRLQLGDGLHGNPSLLQPGDNLRGYSSRVIILIPSGRDRALLQEPRCDGSEGSKLLRPTSARTCLGHEREWGDVLVLPIDVGSVPVIVTEHLEHVQNLFVQRKRFAIIGRNSLGLLPLRSASLDSGLLLRITHG
mmetsp:Transcript_94663/g.253164  ORF Transcript_94663/g.253164 Transcript_94663/m.253164 type:complete len:389 (+) Transcript_94663:214-1380(+)